jgi:hypothetical protein
MKMITQILLILFAAVLGCKKDYRPIIVYPEPPQKDCPNVLPDSLITWKSPLHKDTIRGIASAIQNMDNSLISYVTSQTSDFRNTSLATGHTIWTKKGLDNIAVPAPKNALYSHRSNLIVLTNKFIQKISVETGQEKLMMQPPVGTVFGQALYFGFYGSKIRNHLYTSFAGNQFYDSVSYLLRINLDDHSIDSLTSFNRKDLFGYMGASYPPALHINPAGDSTLIFKFRTVKVEPGINTSRCFLYAYNLSQRKVEWRIDSLDYDGSADPPIIEGDKCYVQGYGTLYCVDANTGQQIWKAWCGGRLPGGSTMISYQDRIAVVTSDGRFICVSKQDGSYIHNRKDVPGGWNNFDMASPSNAVELNGIMYLYGGGYLYGIDLKLGSVAMKYKSPHYCKRSDAIFGYGGIAADAATNQIFVEDQYFLMAVKAVR